MQIFKHHVIFDEIFYDREELKDWYKSVEHYKNDYGVVTNKISSENLSHNKKFRTGRFETLDTFEQAGIHVIEYEPVKKLVQKFNFDNPLAKTDVDVMIYKPGFQFQPHIDFHMHCGIMFPIFPDLESEMAPIDFYKLPPGAIWERAKNYDDCIEFERDFAYSYHYSTKHPSMFDGDTIHGVRNNNNHRVFLRFKILSMTFDEVIKKGESKKLINT
jgi:hypothetical protein